MMPKCHRGFRVATGGNLRIVTADLTRNDEQAYAREEASLNVRAVRTSSLVRAPLNHPEYDFCG
jgi:hypothetical protein